MKKLLILAVMAVFMLPSCSKDQIAINRLEGTWDVSSALVDGEEFIGAFISSFEMEFEEYRDNSGDYTFTVIDFTGFTSVTSGEYTVEDDGTTLVLVYDDGFGLQEEKYDMELTKDELVLDATIDGFRYEFEADKN